MSEFTVKIGGRMMKGAELQTHALGRKPKKAKRVPVRIRGIGTRTRSHFISIKSCTRNSVNDCTHKTKYNYQEFALDPVRRRSRTGPQLLRESNCLRIECSETLIHSFSLLVADFVHFLDAQYVLFQNAQPRVQLSAPCAVDVYRDKKLNRFKKLKATLFATYSADYHLTETSFLHTVSFLLESILRPDPFTVDYTSIVDEALRKSAPVRLYLMLIEKKLDVVRHVTSLPTKTQFEVLGLGNWGAVQALLARLFHLPTATAPPAASSGEKAEPTVLSARHSVGSNHELKSKAAAEKSADFATGIRIVTAWCDYVRAVGRLMHQHRNQRILPLVQTIVDVVREMMAFSTHVRASESALAFDLGSVQMQSDIRNAAGKLDELVAELSVLLIRYCSVDVDNIVPTPTPTPAREPLLPSSSRAHGADGLVQLNVVAQLRSVVPVLRALFTSCGETRQTEATCRLAGARLINMLQALEMNLDHQSNKQVEMSNKQLASAVGSLLRKVKLQLVKMVPAAAQRSKLAARDASLSTNAPGTGTMPPLCPTSSFSASSSSAASLTPVVQLPAVGDLIERVDVMLAELPAEKSDVERLLRINDMTLNASVT